MTFFTLLVTSSPPLGPVSSVFNIPISLTVVGLNIFKIVFKHPFKKNWNIMMHLNGMARVKTRRSFLGIGSLCRVGSGAGTQVIGLDEASTFTRPTSA